MSLAPLDSMNHFKLQNCAENFFDRRRRKRARCGYMPPLRQRMLPRVPEQNRTFRAMPSTQFQHGVRDRKREEVVTSSPNSIVT